MSTRKMCFALCLYAAFLAILAFGTRLTMPFAVAQMQQPGYVRCPAAGFVAGVGYIPEQWVCKCTVTTSCGQGTGAGCSYYIVQFLWVKQADGTWVVAKGDTMELALQPCLSDDDFEVSMFTFDADFMGPQPGQYYYGVGLFKGFPDDPVDAANLLDAAGLYFWVK